MTRYETAKQLYAKIGVDTDMAINRLKNIPLSMHCWQGDDVTGFDTKGALTGGIQATGNYPGKATTPKELMDDITTALSFIPGNHRINLHACYPIFKEGQWADRDALLPEHFEEWVNFAKQNNLGIDFNPTFFSHPKAVGMTLASSDEEIRQFWVRHAICCLKIAEYFANELNTYCLLNIWIPDGLKDIPADRMLPRQQLVKSLNEIINSEYDKCKVFLSVESKVFGIGLEAYTVGSHEFYLNYAAKNNILCLLDNGHYHPTENVADKISSMLLFNDKVALHVTRPVRWDSDHVVRLNDEIKEIAAEIIRCGEQKVLIGLDYFDASINRIVAWVVGMRNMQKALLIALLTPHEQLAQLQKQGDMSALLAMEEELKLMPVGDVWEKFCELYNQQSDWFEKIMQYEKNVLMKR